MVQVTPISTDRTIVYNMIYSTMSRIFSALKDRIPKLQIHSPVGSVTSVFDGTC